MGLALSVGRTGWSPGAARDTGGQALRSLVQGDKEGPVTSPQAVGLHTSDNQEGEIRQHRQVGAAGPENLLFLSLWEQAGAAEPQIQGAGAPVLFPAWQAQRWGLFRYTRGRFFRKTATLGHRGCGVNTWQCVHD